MTASKILIEVDLGIKGVEKGEIFVYKDDKLIETYFDMSFNDIRWVEKKLKVEHEDAEVETNCIGTACTGKLFRWELDR